MTSVKYGEKSLPSGEKVSLRLSYTNKQAFYDCSEKISGLDSIKRGENLVIVIDDEVVFDKTIINVDVQETLLPRHRTNITFQWEE